jgi:radical SAM superfamily enzyme YgiQ (UPF0313 family)
MVGAHVRYRNPVQVVDEMERLSELGFHQINLADDLFTANAEHCLAVCAEILNRGLTVQWTSFARVDTVNRQVLETMRRAGCTTISFGVESGSPDMLRRIRKGITLEQVEHAMQLCKACDIEPHASFILGLPGETQETLRQTLAFGQRLNAMGVNHGFHVLAPFPGTDIREHIDRYDLQILSNDWRKYNANRAIVRTAGVAPDAMDAIVIDSERQFNQWLSDIGHRREQGCASAQETWPLVRLEHTVVLYDLMMKQLVEEKGVWQSIRPIGSARQALDGLIARVADELDHPPARIRAAIEFAHDNRALEYRYEDGSIRWSWNDYL